MVLIRDMLSDLVVHSEHRGPFAAAAALIETDGTVLVQKAPLSASEFVETADHRSLMHSLDSSVTCLKGHTRWPTRSTHVDNRNNHPLLSESDHGTL